MTFTPKNPIIRETHLRAYAGWKVREYADGMFDATYTPGLGLTRGVDSFAEAVAEVRAQESR